MGRATTGEMLTKPAVAKTFAMSSATVIPLRQRFDARSEASRAGVAVRLLLRLLTILWFRGG
jgi:hypothetical protein